jgi:Rod binding domain-containing protein
MKIDNSYSPIIDMESSKNKEIEKVSKDFESMFIKKILESGLEGVSLTEGSGSTVVKGMYIDSMSNSMSGLGISDMLYEHLSQQQKDKK